MSASLQTTQVDLDGLLEVLGKNLYSTPAVAIRELIQNAHDACIRDQYENPASDASYRINIQLKAAQQQIIIEDNGSGLTHDEVVSYLATIGSGYTRQIRQSSDNREMIGYFGLGFLSAYVIADKVEVWTCSYQQPDTAWYFSSKGGQRFSLTQSPVRAQGTRVVLHLSHEHQHLLDEQVLYHLLRKYCCLLPIPIHLNAQEQAVNDLNAPWKAGDQVSPLALKKQQLAFASLFENNSEPLCCIPLKENQLNTHGLIWIQEGYGYATSDYRNVSVFVRNMHITSEARDLLPVWAGFVGCIINTECLTPTASREGLQTDEHYYALQKLIEDSLIDGLKTIAQQEESNWRRILARHNNALLGAVVASPDLFPRMAEDLTVPTSEGDMTLPALLKRSKNRIHLQLDNQASYESVLFKAQMIPLVSGYFFAVSSFCRRYAEQFQVTLLSLGTQQGNNTIFPTENVDSHIQSQLESLLCQTRESLICTRFEPDYIPLILIEDQEILLKQRLESDEADKRIGSAILGLARQYTKSIDNSVERRIYVNLNSPLVNVLLSQTASRQQLVANMLRAYVISLSHGNSQQQDNHFANELRQFTESLTQLMEQDSK